MGNFFKVLQRHFSSISGPSGPGEYSVEGKTVICPHCGDDQFAIGTALLNTAGMTFVGLDWANRAASTLMCAQCGRIEWFGQEPTRL